MTVLALVLSIGAGLLHVGIFVAESYLWRRPQVWQAFGVTSQAAADDAVFFTFNQGYYNLFLAVGAIVGPILIAAGTTVAGWTALVYACASMAAAAIVLRLGCGPSFLRPALIQATLPTLALLVALIGAVA